MNLLLCLSSTFKAVPPNLEREWWKIREKRTKRYFLVMQNRFAGKYVQIEKPPVDSLEITQGITKYHSSK